MTAQSNVTDGRSANLETDKRLQVPYGGRKMEQNNVCLCLVTRMQDKIEPITFKHLKAQCLLCVPPGLTFNNSTFCPLSVFMYFVWIWEQTAIISLCSINWLVFIREI